MTDFDRLYPCVPDMENAARRRMPRFLHDYLVGGLGEESCVARNRQALRDVMLLPRYLSESDRPDVTASLFGQRFDAPFGIAPLGLAGLIWPDCEVPLARAARDHNLLHVLSTYSNKSVEDIAPVVGDIGWFQFYPPNDPGMESDLIARARRVGYRTMVVTVDIPAPTRRERDIRNGMSVPPAIDLSLLLQVARRPEWAMRTLRHGIPDFANLSPYYPEGASLARSAEFLGEVMVGHVSAERFSRLRASWPGKLLVKGVLDPGEAQTYCALGADGVIVSNHGGRQFDAAPSAARMLPAIRKILGPDATILADGGVRSGLDIMRMLALGANFVLIGRPFLHASAAMGKGGGHHLMKILKAELVSSMAQLGAPRIADLPAFLHQPEQNRTPQ
jgi:L-lactate dehydrogenase (cytochrome)